MDAIQRRLRASSPPPIDGCTAEQAAAVFVPMVHRTDRSWHVVLIRRADRGDPWSGQIAFPGGRIDATDADPLAAAYRELDEEVGISAAAVTLVGAVGRFRTQTRPVDVHAFLGVWDGAQPLRPAPAEVAEVIETPCAELCAAHDRAGFADRTVAELGASLRYPAEKWEIWGVTARIIHHLCGQVWRSPTRGGWGR